MDITDKTGQTLTVSDLVVAQLQSAFGTFQPHNLEFVRQSVYSRSAYPAAGGSRLNFYGISKSTAGNDWISNIKQPNQFVNEAFIMKGIGFELSMTDAKLDSYDGTDASALYSELVAGLVQEGVFKFEQGAALLFEIDKPLLNAPRISGQREVKSSGWAASIAGPIVDVIPHASLMTRADNYYNVDPEIFLPSQSSFLAYIEYMRGALAPICDVISPYIMCEMDGYIVRPAQ